MRAKKTIIIKQCDICSKEAKGWNKKFEERSNEAEKHLRYWTKETKGIVKS